MDQGGRILSARGSWGVVLALACAPPACGASPAARGDPEPVWPPLPWLDPLAAARPVAVADSAMAATAHPLATAAALEALGRGGSAVDAAVAAQLVLNVVEPQSSGIGGGCFLLYLPPGAEEPVFVDGREAAPSAADERLFLDASGVPVPYYPDRVTGGRAVGVPGTLAALSLAHGRWGRLEWGSLFEPAIALAREGIVVSRRLHESLRAEADRLRAFPASGAVFFDRNGDPLREGALLVQSDLAATLALIAERGEEPFYRGPIARDIAEAVGGAARAPGRLVAADLAGYRAALRRPVRGRYRDVELFGVGPPSSGGTTMIEILNILEGFDLASRPAGSPEAIHLVLEAGRIAFADRNRYIGDVDHVSVPVDTLVSGALALDRRMLIDPDRAMTSPPSPASIETREAAPARETTHFSIADPDGGLLAMTSTIEQSFGSGMLVPGRGFFLNNELSDFDAEPTFSDGTPRPNRVAPGKRPRSSMAPTILMRDGRPYAALGSPGGSRIIGIVTWVVLCLVDWSMDLQQAIDFPRALNRGRDASELEILYFDDDALADLHGVSGVLDRLRAMGHVIDPPARAYRALGGVHGVRVLNDGRLEGAADPRREGTAVGF